MRYHATRPIGLVVTPLARQQIDSHTHAHEGQGTIARPARLTFRRLSAIRIVRNSHLLDALQSYLTLLSTALAAGHEKASERRGRVARASRRRQGARAGPRATSPCLRRSTSSRPSPTAALRATQLGNALSVEQETRPRIAVQERGRSESRLARARWTSRRGPCGAPGSRPTWRASGERGGRARRAASKGEMGESVRGNVSEERLWSKGGEEEGRTLACDAKVEEGTPALRQLELADRALKKGEPTRTSSRALSADMISTYCPMVCRSRPSRVIGSMRWYCPP